MNKKNIIAFAVVIIFFAAVFCFVKFETPTQPPPYQGGGAESGGGQIKSVNIAGQSVKVDLALTQAEQEQGLSGRKNLLPNTGMLFVFDVPGKYLFWMKDMNFAIDMIWLTKDMKVDYIAKNAAPASYPATFGPGTQDGLASYVLEVPAGFSDKNNLKIGDSVNFTY